MSDTILLRIRRRDEPNGRARWEEFVLPRGEHSTIGSCLAAIERDPKNRKGERVAAVAWSSGCHEGLCGSCTILVNGEPRLACRTPVPGGPAPIRLAPLEKLPLIRDLQVDRSSLTEAESRFRVWLPFDGLVEQGGGRAVEQADADAMLDLSRCTSCAVCFEVCPQVGDRSPFVGPQAFASAWRVEHHAGARPTKAERIDALLGEGGIVDCGQAQLCEASCPEGIPIVEALGGLSRKTTRRALERLIGG